MKQTFREWLSALRIWFGWGGLSESRLSPAHGWLLPTPGRRHPRAPRRPTVAGTPLGSSDGSTGGAENLP
jgi:hypothetical protein